METIKTGNTNWPENDRIKISFGELLTALAIIFLSEAFAPFLGKLFSHMGTLLLIRLFEITGILYLLNYWIASRRKSTIEKNNLSTPSDSSSRAFIRKSLSFKALNDFHASLLQMNLPWPLYLTSKRSWPDAIPATPEHENRVCFHGKKNFSLKDKNTIFNSIFSINNVKKGIKYGILWSICFSGMTLVAGIAFLLLTGINPLKFILFSMPKEKMDIVLFLVTGGLVSPVAEELFFRGILYSFFRKYGTGVAVVISTTLFALSHFSGDNIPLVQITGGLLFAIAFEHSGNIVAPITIHILANMGIFFINLLHQAF
ncbi:putative metal-dependent membrane protease [Desulfamplus magnetovallimortis]|uniref:Putative metal-dependent membrane protease n=1 Tax=Desulfamplus magnetovallimortis TaxID=1246637 RepID=A0A1W1H4Q5_9BACT|nr:CPBP family intramembrane glutamic endopeptidase [Desulfamplus magnetovallimortis]SLM27348.1 putative metal-dependent membrane protease [Desulfamplus magnetovallimortis]